MGLTHQLHGELIDPWVSYNRNAGLALNMDLALLCRHGTPHPCLSQNAELLRPARNARCGVPQTRVRRRVPQTRVWS